VPVGSLTRESAPEILRGPSRYRLDVRQDSPGVDQSAPKGTRVAHNCQVMNERRGCDESISIRARIGYLERGAAPCHRYIHRQNAIQERGFLVQDSLHMTRQMFSASLERHVVNRAVEPFRRFA